MARKIFTIFLIAISSIMMMASLVGIGLAWIYNGPLTREAISRLQGADAGLAQIQSDLSRARTEVERALRIIESAEKSLQSLTQQTQDASQTLQQVTGLLDDKLIPDIQTARQRISQLRGTLESLRETLKGINNLPFLNGLNIPGDDTLANIIKEVDSLDSDVADVQDLAHKASTFISDTSYLLGGDFSETKNNLQTLLQNLKDYDEKITGWRTQIKSLIESIPRWIDDASIIITIFLLWFGFSQFGLFVHGLNMRDGKDPWAVIRRSTSREMDDDGLT